MASNSQKPSSVLRRVSTSGAVADVVPDWTTDPSVGDEIRHRGTAASVVTQPSAATATTKGS